MWQYFLADWNGVSFFYDDKWTDSADLELYTDASGAHGYGGYFQGKWFAEPWPSDFPKLGDDGVSIAFMELVPIVTAVYIWYHSWSRKRILFHCDNTATVSIICKGRSKSPMIMKLMRRLTLCCALGNLTVSAVHIPGSKNVLSDLLSRSKLKAFHLLAPRAEKHPTLVPPIQDLYFN